MSSLLLPSFLFQRPLAGYLADLRLTFLPPATTPRPSSAKEVFHCYCIAVWLAEMGDVWYERRHPFDASDTAPRPQGRSAAPRSLAFLYGELTRMTRHGTMGQLQTRPRRR